MKGMPSIYEKSLDDNFEKRRSWYQNNSSEYVCGKIRYNDEGIFLDTIFAIDDPKNKKDFFVEMGRDKLNKFSRIRGIIETNEVTILEDLTEIASSNIKKTY